MSLRQLFAGLRASGKPCLVLPAGDHAEQQRRGAALASRQAWIMVVDGWDGPGGGFDELVLRRILRAASAVVILSPVDFPEEMVEPLLADVARLERWVFVLTTVEHHGAWSRLADRYQTTAERLEGFAGDDTAGVARRLARGDRRV